MTRLCSIAFAVICCVCLGCGSGQPAIADAAQAVPTPTGPTLGQVAQNAPAVLYFVKTDCGSNSMAIPLVQAIYAANENSGKFYVVMNGDAETVARWAKEHKTTFPIIADPEMKIIGKYHIAHSQTGILVDKGLKETKRFPGYGRAALEDLNRNLAGAGTPAKVDISSAPTAGYG